MEERCWREEGPREENAWRFNHLMKSHGFSRTDRLSTQKEFKAVFKGGKRNRRHPLLHACILKISEDHTRLGLSVSKKTGNAVARNRIKRILREIFRKNKGVFEKGVDVVLIPRPGIANCDYRALEKIFFGFRDGNTIRK